MDNEELVGTIYKMWDGNVKPEIDSGNYMAAFIEMGNLVGLMETNKRVMSALHFGLNYMYSALMLYKTLKTCTERPDALIKDFEMDRAQSRLPTKYKLEDMPNNLNELHLR